MVISYYRNGSVRQSERAQELERLIARAEAGDVAGGQYLLNFEEEALCIYEPPSPGHPGIRSGRRFWGPEPGLELLQEDRRA
jgi:hypothetical protein